MTKLERMLQAVPNYYQFSPVYQAILQASATELDDLEITLEDLRDQLYISTATWGLKYWEESVGLPISEADSYALRRSRIKARLSGDGNFSATQLEDLAAAYGTTVRVEIDFANYMVTIVFLEGVPSFLEEYQDAARAIIHAHLGDEYEFEIHLSDDINVVSSEIKRYVHVLPFICAADGSPYATLCGTYPSPVESQYSFEATDIQIPVVSSASLATYEWPLSPFLTGTVNKP